jgi:NAD(P)-dependent dehydrogenase (short-subunit alcohol dehydrogenase family)
MNTYLDKFRLDGKVALITGGSRGLGLEAAEALAEAGARVALLARREQFFEEARERLPSALTLLGDVSNESDVERAVAETAAKLGPVQILINAAGISWAAPATEMPAEKMLQVMAVNLHGTFYACKAVAPGMQALGYGKIINFSSVAGLKGEPPEVLDAVGYSASKGAVIALTRDLAVKWGRFGIRVNALAPGFFPTRMTEKVVPRVTERLKHEAPLGRPGQPGELGGPALFLASPASDFITGQVLVVDGGVVAA